MPVESDEQQRAEKAALPGGPPALPLPPENTDIDLNKLALAVVALLKEELRLERERLG